MCQKGSANPSCSELVLVLLILRIEASWSSGAIRGSHSPCLCRGHCDSPASFRGSDWLALGSSSVITVGDICKASELWVTHGSSREK